MFRGVFCSVLIGVLIGSTAVLPANAQSLEQPPTLSVNGSAKVPRAAEARRFDLIGTVPLYSVAVYADRLDRAQLAPPDVAKAVRIVITFREDLRRTIRVDSGVAVSRASHDLMLAFLDHWIGQRPVSEEMKRALLGSSRLERVLGRARTARV
jgi:hypothetical protein